MANDSHLFRTRDQLGPTDGCWRERVRAGWGDGDDDAGPRDAEGAAAQQGERYLPLYEAKMIHHFDHRWATYDGLNCGNDRC